MLNMIKQFNHLCKWVQLSVIGEDSLKQRAELICKILNIASECHQYNNFSATCAIYTGLNASPVYRLKVVWERVRKTKEYKIMEI
eukprot:UN03044